MKCPTCSRPTSRASSRPQGVLKARRSDGVCNTCYVAEPKHHPCYYPSCTATVRLEKMGYCSTHTKPFKDHRWSCDVSSVTVLISCTLCKRRILTDHTEAPREAKRHVCPPPPMPGGPVVDRYSSRAR